MKIFKYTLLLSSIILPLKAMEETKSPTIMLSPTKRLADPIQQEEIDKYYAEKYFLPVIKDLDDEHSDVYKSYESFIKAPYKITGYKKNIDWNSYWKKFWEPQAKIERSLKRPKEYNLEALREEIEDSCKEILNSSLGLPVKILSPSYPLEKEPEDKPNVLLDMSLTLPAHDSTKNSFYIPKEIIKPEPIVWENFSIPFENDPINKETDGSYFKGMDSSILAKSINDTVEEPVSEKINFSKEYEAQIEKEERRKSNMAKETFLIESDLRYIQEYYKENYPESIFGKLSKEKEDQVIESATFLIKNGKILDNGEALKKAVSLIEEEKNVSQSIHQESSIHQEEELKEVSSNEKKNLLLDNYVYIHEKLIEQYNGLMQDYNKALDEIAELKDYRIKTENSIIELKESHLEQSIKLKDALAEIITLQKENSSLRSKEK